MTTSNVWLTGDLANILRGLALVSGQQPGYYEALRAVALSLGIQPPPAQAERGRGVVIEGAAIRER